MDESTVISPDQFKKAISLVYKLGFNDGVAQFAWMKDGVSYVGTSGTTLKYARQHAEDLPFFRQIAEVLTPKSRTVEDLINLVEERIAH